MESDQLSQIEKSQKAEKLIDEILPHLPDYGVFHFAYYAKEVLHWDHENAAKYALYEKHVAHLALNQFKYVSEKTVGYYYELTDLGREAKSKGGHFKFLDYLKEKETLEIKRQKLNDEKLRYDVKNSKRIFKTYWWTFFISVSAFLLALGKIIYDVLMKTK